MIIFENVSKHYRMQNTSARSLRQFMLGNKTRNSRHETFTALKNVSFHINKGETIGIIGHNGAGKSTLLKLLTRICLPSEGSISVKGSISCLLEVGAGFHMELTGLENIFLSGAILGMTKKEIAPHISEIIDFSQMAEFIDNPAGTYSSGMLLRLAFSIGIFIRSDILVIDEALSVGDHNFQKKCFDKIIALKKSHKTIIFVSHDTHQIEKICDRVIVMHRGACIYFGEPASAIARYYEIAGESI